MLQNYDDFNAYYSSTAPMNFIEKGDECCAPNYHIKRTNSPIYAMEYILEGKNEFQINGKSFVAEAGDIVFLPKNSNHSYSAVKNCSCRKLWFVFDGGFVNHFESYYLPKNKYCFHADDAKEIFQNVIQLTASNAEEYAASLEKFSLLLYKLFMGISSYEHLQTLSGESIAEKMQKYIDENIMEHLTLQKLADAFHYSKNHTIVLFRNHFGITPNQYFLNRKMELACLYLRNTNLSVKAISELLHFADQHYFSNVFYKWKKMSPVQYRKSLEAGLEAEHSRYISKQEFQKKS